MLLGGKVGRKICIFFFNVGKYVLVWLMLVEILIYFDWLIKFVVIDNWEGILYEFF